MKIEELDPTDKELLAQFKAKEYPSVDKEHYGEIPDFTFHEFTLVIKDEEGIAGYIDVTVCLGVAYVKSLLIGAAYRGKGVGKELMDATEEKIKALGAHKVWLETGSNWQAKAFYEKLGYSMRTILPNDVNGQESVLMDKML